MSLSSKGGKKTEVFLLLLSHHIELPTFFFFFSSGTTPSGRRVCPPVARESRRATGGRPCGPARPPARRAGRFSSFLPSSPFSLYLSSSSFVVARSGVFLSWCLGIFGFWWVCFCGNTVFEYWVCSDRSIFPTFADFLWFLNPLASALVLAGWLAGGCFWAAAGAPVFSFWVLFFCSVFFGFWFWVLGGFFSSRFRASFGRLQAPMVDGGLRFVSVICFQVFRVHDLMIPDNC